MAYGDESPLVGLNYVRAAATNLTLTNVTASLMPFSHPPALEEVPPSTLRVETMGQQPGFGEVPHSPTNVPSFAGYNDPKANSSLLKRLAEKFGIPK
jgi:hypothetical protein